MYSQVINDKLPGVDDYLYTSDRRSAGSRWRSSTNSSGDEPSYHAQWPRTGDTSRLMSDTVKQHSRLIIDQIARERSTSPVRKPQLRPRATAYDNYSPTPSPPPRPVPPMKPLRSIYKGAHEDYGTSVVSIPGRRSHSDMGDFSRSDTSSWRDNGRSQQNGLSYHSNRVATDHGRGDSSRISDNVIRLSVSGEHSNGNTNSSSTKPWNGVTRGQHVATNDNRGRNSASSYSPRRDTVRSRSYYTAGQYVPEPPNGTLNWRRENGRHDNRSPSTSPERNVYHHTVLREGEENPIFSRTVTDFPRLDKRYNENKTSVRHESDHSNHPPELRNSHYGLHGNLNDSSAITDRLGKSRSNSPDKKRKIRIKFSYDDDKNEPSEIRLSKYREYHGGATGHLPRVSLNTGQYSTVNRSSPQRSERHSRAIFNSTPVASMVEDDSPSSMRGKSTASHAFGRRVAARPEGVNYHSVSPSPSSSPDRHLTVPSPTAAEHHDNKIKIGSSIVNNDGHRVYRMDLPNNHSLSPDATLAPKKKGWLSSTLSRLDLRSRKATRSKSVSRQRGASETRSGSSAIQSTDNNDDNSRSREISLTRTGRTYVCRPGGSSAHQPVSQHMHAGTTPDSRDQQRQQHGQIYQSTATAGSRPIRSETESPSVESRHKPRSAVSQSTVDLTDADRRRKGSQPAVAVSGRRLSDSRASRQRPHSASLDNVTRAEDSRLGRNNWQNRSPLRGRAPFLPPGGGHYRLNGSESTCTSLDRSTSSRDVSASSVGVSREYSPVAPRRRDAATPKYLDHRSNSKLNKSVSEMNARNSTGVAVPGSAASRSVYLHATTVADIPSPDKPDSHPTDSDQRRHIHRPAVSASHLATGSDSTRTQQQRLPNRERRRVARSFSLIGPFRPRHRTASSSAVEINYENSTGLAAGKPPRHPQPRSPSRSRGDRDKSSTSSHAGAPAAGPGGGLASSDDSSPRPYRPVSRSISMARGIPTASGQRPGRGRR